MLSSVVSSLCLIGAVIVDRKLYTAPRTRITKNLKSTGQKKINLYNKNVRKIKIPHLSIIQRAKLIRVHKPAHKHSHSHIIYNKQF